MKRFCFLFLLLLMVSGMAMAGAPLTGYIMKKTKGASLHTFSANATTIRYLKNGDTIALSGSQNAFSEYFRETILLGDNSLVKILAGDTIKGNGVRPMGIKFPLDGREYTHFGLSGNGTVYFGTAENGIIPGVVSKFWRGDCGGSFIYNAFIRPTAKFTNMQDGKFEPATVRATANTRIQYETVNDTLYIGFENLSVINQAGTASLTASFQYKITSNGDMMLIIGGLNSTTDNDFTYRFTVQSRFTSGSGTARSLYDWDGTLNDYNTGDLPIGTGSDSLRNVAFQLMPPPPCDPITGLDIDVNGRIDVGKNEIAFSSYGFNWDREKAPNLLIVLSDKEATLKNELTDGTVYKDTDKIGGFPVRVSLNTGYIYSFKDLNENTTYYLHIFPFNATTCAGGPLYGQETIIPVTTTFAPPAEIAVTEVGRTDMKVAVQTTDKYIFAVSEKILGGLYPAAFVLKNGTTYKQGDQLKYGDVNLRILAVGTEAATLNVDQLQANQDVYFYAWAMRGDGAAVRYSKNYTEAVDKTIGPAPTYLDFSKYKTTADFLPPAGWHSSMGSMNPHFVINEGGDRDSYFEDNVFSSDPVSTSNNAVPVGKAAYIWAASPWLEGSGQMQALFNLAFFTVDASSGAFSLYNTLKASDSVVFRMQAQGETDWKRIGCLDKNSDWKGGMGEVVTEAFMADNVFRLRVDFYQDTLGSNVRLAIKSMEVEEFRSCQYVRNLVAPLDEMGYLSARVSWKDGNKPNADHFILNYGPVAQEDKWIEATTRDLRMDLTNLEANTLYEANIVAVCKEEDSSIVKTIQFTTKAEVPYGRNDWSVKNLEEIGYRSLKGKAGSVLTPFDPKEDQGGWALMQDDQDNSSVVGIYRSLVNVENSWLATPAIYSKYAGKVKLSLGLAAYIYNETTQEKQAATGIGQTDTLYIYRSATGSSNVFSEIVGRIALKDLQTQHTPFECEISVKEYSPNVFAFYIPKIQDMGNVLNWSTLSMSSIDIAYETIEYPAVTNLHTENLGKTEVTVVWSGNEEANEYALLYKQRKAEKYDTVYTENTRYQLTDLASGTQYAYRVFGYYGEGRTLPGRVSDERYVNTVKECVPPTNLTVVAVSWQGATLACQSEDERQVRFTAQDAERYPDVNYLSSWRAGRDTMTYKGLFDGLEFSYRAAVRAVCAPGDTSVWSSSVDFTTTPIPPCGVPTNLASNYDAATRMATLSWENGQNNDATWVLIRKEGIIRYDTFETKNNIHILPNVETGSVYLWRLQGLCDDYFVSSPTGEEQIKITANESVCTYAQAVAVRVNGRQIVVENPEHRLIKALNIYDATGKKIKTYAVNGSENVFIHTDLNQGMVVIEVIGAGTEKTTVKAVVM